MINAVRDRAKEPWVDVALAVAFVVLSQVEIRHSWDDGFRAGSLALNTPLVALVAAPLALRSVAPRLGLALMVLAAAVPGVFVPHTILFWGGLIPLLMMVFAVARHDGGIAGRFTWVVWVPLVLGGLRNPEWSQPGNLLFGTVAFVFTWLGARLVRQMDTRRANLAAALQLLSSRQAEREAEVVAAERARIAAEMHDVVSHAVSLMVIQLGAARLALDRDGDAAAEVGRLAATERTGREALDELRRSLGVLRGSGP